MRKLSASRLYRPVVTNRLKEIQLARRPPRRWKCATDTCMHSATGRGRNPMTLFNTKNGIPLVVKASVACLAIDPEVECASANDAYWATCVGLESADGLANDDGYLSGLGPRVDYRHHATSPVSFR